MHKDVDSAHHSRDADLLRVASRREGCPVCIVVLENMDLAMDTWNYEGFTDVADRQFLARIRGFCPLHTWQLAQRNNTFQLAVVYQEILSEMVETMNNEGREQRNGSQGAGEWMAGVRRLFQPDSPPSESAAQMYALCPFCRTRANIEQRIVERLVELVQSEEIQQLLCQSTGLCRLHFAQASQYAEERKPAQQRTLIACQRACLQRTLDEVKELIRKHDYHFSEEPRGEEMTSWRRAAKLCAGNPGVY